MTPATSTDVGTDPPATVGPPATAPPERARSPRRTVERRLPAVLLAPAGLAAAVAAVPLVYLAIRAAEGGLATVLEVLVTDRTVSLVLRSLALSGAVTAVCLVLGISLAGLVVRTRLPGRRVWGVLVVLPLAVPSYVAAFAWLSMFPRFGGFLGSTLVLSLCCYPYVYLPVAAALVRIDPAHEEVSRSLGAGQGRTFLSVTVRQVRPAAAGGGLLVALYVLSDFGAVALRRFDVFTRVIYTSYRSSFDLTPTAVLGCLLVVLTMLIVWGENRTRGRAGYARLGGGAARRRPPTELGGWAVLAVAWCGLVVSLAVAVPLAALGYWLVQGTSAGLDIAEVSVAAGSMLTHRWGSTAGGSTNAGAP